VVAFEMNVLSGPIEL